MDFALYEEIWEFSYRLWGGCINLERSVEPNRRSQHAYSQLSQPDAATDRRPKRYWLEHGKHYVELQPGVCVIGRSSTCHVVLADPMVSRRHAELRVGAEGVSVEDSGSANGVYVNSRRIEASLMLEDGDHLQIGSHDLVLHVSLLTEANESGERFSAETLREALASDSNPARVVPENEATFSARTLDLLGGVADKVLARGRGDEAEKMLATTLASLLLEVRKKRTSAVASEVLDRAALYAVRLADATGKAKWVDYAIELFTLTERPFPAAVVDCLYEALRHCSGISLSALRAYLELLRARQQSFGPTERFLLQRLEGLEPLVGLR